MELYKVIQNYPTEMAAALADYPIFDNDPVASPAVTPYRPGLNTKILNHYMNLEISVETASRFMFNLRRKMWEIMPYYNKLYLSDTLTVADALKTNDLTTVVNLASHSQGNTSNNNTSSGTTGGNQTTTSGTRSVDSDFPQTMLNGSEDYASNGNDVNGTVTGESTGTSSATSDDTGSSTVDDTQNSTQTFAGMAGVPADLIMRYRASLLNIDMQIIDELKELFMLVWDTGDNYTVNNDFYGFPY